MHLFPLLELENCEKSNSEYQQQLEEAESSLDDAKTQLSRLHQHLMDCQEKLQKATSERATSSEIECELQTTREQLKAALQLHGMSREHEEFQESELQLQREELLELRVHLDETRQQLAEERLISEGRSNDIEWLNRSNKELG